MPADQATIAAVVKAAQDAGVDPAYALAVTDRESGFNPNAKASKTIYGLQQMSAGERAKYGSGDSNDPYTQTKGWAGYMQDVNSEMAKSLGRAPTPQESYLGHFWGGTRAARIASGQIPPETPTSQVFTPRELAENPEIAKAKSVGALKGQVMNDITNRMGKYADYSSGSPPATTASNYAAQDRTVTNQNQPNLNMSSQGRPAISPETAMQLQDQNINPEADVNMEQPPPSIQKNWQQSPLDVPQQLPPDQEAGLVNQLVQQRQQAQNQAPPMPPPRSVNSLQDLWKLYPQKQTG